MSKPPRLTTGQFADARMRMTLGGLGFDGRPSGAPVVAPIAPPPRPDPAIALALRRREWALDVAERQRALSPRTGGVPVVESLSSDDFLDHFYAPGRPVVIRGAMAGWPALAKWTPAYLAETVGAAEIEYQGGRSGAADFELAKDRHRQRMPFDRYMAMIAREPGNDAYITAYNNAGNSAALAPLMADLGDLPRYLTPASGMMWIGPADTFTPLHFDLTNNLLAQIVGTKRILLAPPSETGRLHNRRHVFSDVHDLADPARLANYPSAKAVRHFTVDLAAGDLLYIPIGWWHQVRSLSFSVMLTYTNFLWPNAGHESFPEG
ncbi:cupin-like domain-containing protein [Sphingomonas naphthae]|uniref:Cupin-like domain-containing protein n=1 Tax=Sphingomonas naphthae TaxID=1813468 RepID=A0ABY7TPT4_9SPHN|nr:cupin-like domain-containing protein [Sphingomonas naphthae]WCT75247.1 cupin-like domain-containing protein [Sphingomonas naphthae]